MSTKKPAQAPDNEPAENERASEMTYEFLDMPNLRMLRAKAAQEQGAAVVPEPEATAAPATASASTTNRS